MKLFVVAFAIVAVTTAAVVSPANEYLPATKDSVVNEIAAPIEEVASPEADYLPPSDESAPLADDGYRYKTVRRLKYRHRRDVSELASPEYLPPAEEPAAAPENEYLPPAEESAPLADDGYRYKTVRRLKYRHRRDVSELASPEYLPPAEEPAAAPENEYLPPTEESAPLADDGYRYKTVRRLKYRHRRDVSELSAAGYDYVPPAAEEAAAPKTEEATVPESDYLPPAEESAPLADDGYRYKTVRRIRYRHRRDVSELASPEYLPPAEEPAAAPENEYIPPAEESAPLADDGYRYKTVRRLKYRHRRDVSELASPEYLPPAEEPAAAPENEYLPPAEESAPLADDGYRYKTVRRIRYRHRRDVSELASPEYLPPAEEPAAAPENEYLPPAEESAPLADDGYRYKTVRRLKYRHRRDVSELSAAGYDYVPPAAEEAAAPKTEEATVPESDYLPPAEESAPLADDGYRYKTVRRIRYRHRRDVSELASPEYLPPAEEPAAAPENEYIPPAEESAPLADDGYRYKTVRRLKYRHRRDVSELASPEYLPPAEEPAAAPENEYLPPAEESAPLADDGYRYKTVRRIRYRHRRDVSELASPEYLPPAEEPAAAPENEYLPPAEESAPLADDGYRYKTVRRLKYRHRRDVSELPAAGYDYVPPAAEEVPVPKTEETTVPESDYLPPAEESAPLAEDGYRYKTVRRIRYRYRH